MTDPAEKHGYAKGYAAGRRRARNDRSREVLQRQQDAFWQRAFLAALPICIEATNWKAGEKPITTLKARTELARDFADEALRLAMPRI